MPPPPRTTRRSTHTPNTQRARPAIVAPPHRPRIPAEGLAESLIGSSSDTADFDAMIILSDYTLGVYNLAPNIPMGVWCRQVRPH